MRVLTIVPIVFAASCTVMALTAVPLATAALAGEKTAPVYRVVQHISIEPRKKPPTFSPTFYGLMLLDRGRKVHLGRPAENRSALTMLDLTTLEIGEVVVPEIAGRPCELPNLLNRTLHVARPLYFDGENGTAGILLTRGCSSSEDAVYVEWDLRANKLTRRFPFVTASTASIAGIEPIGYDPVRRELYVEILRIQVDRQQTRPRPSCTPSGPYFVTIVGITDRVREIASFSPPLRMGSSGPYYDPVHHRSMHVEYAECEEEQTVAFLVDLDSGKMKMFALPHLVYGFEFDPDGRTGYVYSAESGEIFALDLETGTASRRRNFGPHGHGIGFIGPGVLALLGSRGIHLLDSKTLGERSFIPSSAFHGRPASLEGSLLLQGRGVIRCSDDVYVLEFSGMTAAEPAKRSANQ